MNSFLFDDHCSPSSTCTVYAVEIDMNTCETSSTWIILFTTIHSVMWSGDYCTFSYGPRIAQISRFLSFTTSLDLSTRYMYITYTLRRTQHGLAICHISSIVLPKQYQYMYTLHYSPFIEYSLYSVRHSLYPLHIYVSYTWCYIEPRWL